MCMHFTDVSWCLVHIRSISTDVVINHIGYKYHKTICFCLFVHESSYMHSVVINDRFIVIHEIDLNDDLVIY